jgi:septum formation protein
VPLRLVLASSSPRRRELLTTAGYEFDIASPDIDESERPGEAPDAYVERLAREKCEAVTGDLVLAADTTVALDGVIFGKPEDDAEARRMLRALSGRAHHVHTGVALRRRGTVRSFVVTTEVVFVDLADHEIDAYIASGEPTGKAGAYALQGRGARLVSHVRGSVSGVIGLPMAEVAPMLDRATASILRHNLTFECAAEHGDALAEEVTIALCGVVEHPGACRWPHMSMRDDEGDRIEFAVIALAPPDEFDAVRSQLVSHFAKPGLDRPWTLTDDRLEFVDRADRDDWWNELSA